MRWLIKAAKEIEHRSCLTTYRPAKGERQNDRSDFGLGENETGPAQHLSAGISETATAKHSW